MKEKTLNNLSAKYIDECTYTKRLRPETIRGYESVLSTFSKIMPEIQEIDDLIPDLLSEFFKRLSTRDRVVGKDKNVNGVKNSTTHTYWSKLNSFFEWLVGREHLEKNPLKLISKPSEPIYDDNRRLEKEELDKILSAICTGNQDQFLLKRDMAMFYVLLFTGIRKGELLGISVYDIDLDQRKITIRGETSKSKVTKTLPIHPTLLMYLQNYLQIRKEKKTTIPDLWLNHHGKNGLTKDGLKHWVNKYIKNSGIHFHVHQFRHTFACSLAEKDVSPIKIQRLMGHKDMKMTQVYLRSITTNDCKDDIMKLVF